MNHPRVYLFLREIFLFDTKNEFKPFMPKGFNHWSLLDSYIKFHSLSNIIVMCYNTYDETKWMDYALDIMHKELKNFQYYLKEV